MESNYQNTKTDQLGLLCKMQNQGGRSCQKISLPVDIGADTLVWLGDQIFGKPKDMNEARDTLLFLSGRTHMVSTGLCLINQKEKYSVNKVETSEVTFRELDEDIIENYFQAVDPLDKAGSYAIQTRSDLIIENFKGYSNVVGLPVETVRLGLWKLASFDSNER